MTELAEYESRLQQAERELRSAEAAAAEANERVARAEREATALRQVVTGLRVLNQVERSPDQEWLPVETTDSGHGSDSATAEVKLTASGNEGAPRGREAVRMVMTSDPRPWKVKDLVDEIRDRGWVDPAAKQPDAAIRVAVRRLADDGEIERVPGVVGIYRLKTSGMTTPGIAARTAGEPEALTLEGGVEVPPPMK